MRRSRVVVVVVVVLVVGEQIAVFQVKQPRLQGRSRAEMREMFIKCFAFALHNYQFCAI